VLVFSLTQATTIREVEALRQQIFRIKGLPLPPPVDTTIRPMSSSHHHHHQQPSNGRPVPTHDLLPLDKYHHLPPSPSNSNAGPMGLSSVPLVIVGTKSDLTAEREVSREMVTRMATLWGVPFYETSAKRNSNVNAVFMDIVRQMKDKYPDGSRVPPSARKKDKFKCTIQ